MENHTEKAVPQRISEQVLYINRPFAPRGRGEIAGGVAAHRCPPLEVTRNYCNYFALRFREIENIKQNHNVAAELCRSHERLTSVNIDRAHHVKRLETDLP